MQKGCEGTLAVNKARAEERRFCTPFFKKQAGIHIFYRKIYHFIETLAAVSATFHHDCDHIGIKAL